MTRLTATISGILVTIAFAITAVAVKTGHAEDFNCINYALTPPSLVDSVAPSTTLIVDSSGSMNEHAYQESEIIWKYKSDSIERRGYTGFNPAKEYYGFFDPYAYYAYNSTGEHFYPSAAGEWNGNFMNWVSMHRTDIVRKVLTGGPYDVTDGTYKVSRTDASGTSYRGKYHVIDATNPVTDLNKNSKHIVPTSFQGKFGFVQVNNTDKLYVYAASDIETSTSPHTWNIDTLQNSYTLKIRSEKKYGVIDRFGYRMRLALFRYDNDGDLHNGGKILNYMTSDPSEISDIINNIDTITMNSWTPLAETFHTVVGFVQQDNTNNYGPRYETDSYEPGIGTVKDPFYFEKLGKNIYCTQQNVILITDGESTKDKNIPEKHKTLAADVGKNDNEIYNDDGSGYLDNIAYWAHTNDLRDDLIGEQTINLYTIFAFGSGSQLLKDAAKWGGFIDKNNNKLPDPGEYDTRKEGEPDNYFEATDGSGLENALVVAFSSILSRVSSGTAASVVTTSREGTGFLTQAVYWPQLRDQNGTEITWAGDVFSYWLDEEGIMYEDNGLTSGTLDSSDSKISIWYDSTATPKRTLACSGGTVINNSCVNGTTKEIGSVKHLWSVAKWLNSNSLDAQSQRNFEISTPEDHNKRYIFTWKGHKDGKIYKDDIIDFTANKFPETSATLNASTVDWIRGTESSEHRSRKIFTDTDSDGIPDSTVIWRLGDVINSSPTVVATPTENFDLVWNDASYTDFYIKYKERRTMIYFGANDGMLHAVNGGFYNEDTKSYCTHINTDGSCDSSKGFKLGAEVWAYVPYNMHPHLSCLTDKNYQHQYYVDLKPRVFEAQIFDKDSLDHPNGWGTILVTGFNFGGDGQQDLVKDGNYFGSSFSIFDVTNPEKKPELLGEFTYDGKYTLGYALNQPTVVAVKDSTGEKHWYMLFGTGPLEPDGSSTQKAQVLVIPMSKLVDKTTNKANAAFPLRLDKTIFKPTMDKLGVLSLSDSNSAMGTGFSAVDYDFDFFVDMMYYGTVVTNKKDMTGGVHRLKIEAEPDPSKWERKEMTDTGGPMTGGINVGFKEKNVWVYFGTGKFWDTSDKTDVRLQWLYGIMEPKKTASSAYNFSQIPVGSLIDVTDFYVRPDGSGDLFCKSTNSTGCLPTGVKTVEDLEVYIRDTPNIDGWRRAMVEATGERSIGEPSLFGGLVNFITSIPSNDSCQAEGSSRLYSLYYLTGTAWKENVFGEGSGDYIPFIIDLGQGLGVKPSLHLGKEEGVRIFVQTTTGSIIEIHQPNLPISNVKAGRGGWHTIELE